MSGTSAQKEGVIEAAFSSFRTILPHAKQAYKERRGRQISQESNPQNSPHGHEIRGYGPTQYGEPFVDPFQTSYLDLDSGNSGSTNNVHHTPSLPIHINPSEKSPTFASEFSQAMMGLGSEEMGSHASPDASDTPREKPKYVAPSHAPTRHLSRTGGNDLRNIENILIKAGYEFKDLQAPLEQEETVEEAIRRFIGQYRRLALAFNQERQKHHEALQYASDRNDLQARLGHAENELNKTTSSWKKCHSDLEKKKLELFHAEQDGSMEKARHMRVLNDYKERINRLNEEHKRALGAEKTRLNREKADLKARCEEQIRTARTEEAQLQEATIQSLDAQLHALGKEWKEHNEDVIRDWENRLGEANFKFDTQREAQNTEHYRQIRAEEEKRKTLTNKYDAQISQLQFRTDEEKSKLHDEIQELKRMFKEEQERSAKELRDLRKELNQKHKYETLQLQKNYEAVKLGLFERKHFKGLRDRDLTGQFTAIVGQVRDFANLDWDLQRESEWPFSEDQLLAIHEHNIRKLKKQLLQNSLWIILYNFVFRTPFRILGPEGRELDSDWTHIHTPNTKSHEWPEISEEVEKQRFETAKSVLSVIEPSGQASGSEVRLKASYEGAIETTLEALYRALAKVANLETRHRTVLQNIVRLCAKTWMQFCSQPYRLIVTLPSGSGDFLSSPQRGERALTLVISPELKRYGNSQGENLTRGEVVPDCQAAVQTYPTR